MRWRLGLQWTTMPSASAVSERVVGALGERPEPFLARPERLLGLLASSTSPSCADAVQQVDHTGIGLSGLLSEKLQHGDRLVPRANREGKHGADAELPRHACTRKPGSTVTSRTHSALPFSSTRLSTPWPADRGRCHELPQTGVTRGILDVPDVSGPGSPSAFRAGTKA